MSGPIAISKTVDIGGGRGRLAPAPAASLARIDEQLGRPADVNDAWRSPAQADANYAAWLAYLNGGPKAPYALPARDSIHCRGYAVDSDDWYDATAAAVWRRNGWRQTARYPDNPKKDEPWHGEYDEDLDEFYGRPAGGVTPSKKKETKVKTYHYEDATARKSGRTVKPGQGGYLHLEPGVPTSKASNVVGGVGEYSLTAHLYAQGTPGDVIVLRYLWDNTRTAGPHSGHYEERLVVDKDGLIRASREFKRGVPSGFAVYLQFSAPATNKGSVKITVLDSDAYLFLSV